MIIGSDILFKYYLIQQLVVLISNKHLFFFPHRQFVFDPVRLQSGPVRACVQWAIRTPEHLPAAGQEVSDRLINAESDKKSSNDLFKILNFARIS